MSFSGILFTELHLTWSYVLVDSCIIFYSTPHFVALLSVLLWIPFFNDAVAFLNHMTVPKDIFQVFIAQIFVLLSFSQMKYHIIDLGVSL